MRAVSEDSNPENVSTQRELVNFLMVDLDLAFTFLQTARLEIEDSPERFRLAVSKAREALKTIRRFEVRIADEETRSRIQNRSNQLEAAIAALTR